MPIPDHDCDDGDDGDDYGDDGDVDDDDGDDVNEDNFRKTWDTGAWWSNALQCSCQEQYGVTPPKGKYWK